MLHCFFYSQVLFIHFAKNPVFVLIIFQWSSFDNFINLFFNVSVCLVDTETTADVLFLLREIYSQVFLYIF